MNDIIQANLFDYAALDATVHASLRQRAERINERTRNIAHNIWENGREFYEAQQELAQHGHGSFIAWAEGETGYSKQTVYNCISVYRVFNCPNFGQLNIAASALYLMAAPSTPDDVREEALARAEAGERITHQKVKAIIVAQTPPAPAALDDSDDGEPLTPYEEATLRSYVGAALGSPAAAPPVPVVSPVVQAYIGRGADYGYTVTPRTEGGYAIAITATGAVCAPAATDLDLAKRVEDWAHIDKTKAWLDEWPTTHAPAPAPAASPQRIAVEDEDGDVIIDIDTTGIDDLGAVALRAITEALRLLLRGEAHQVDAAELDRLTELLHTDARPQGHATGTLVAILSEISQDAEALTEAAWAGRAA